MNPWIWVTIVYFHAIFQTLSYFTRIMKRVNKQADELKRLKKMYVYSRYKPV